jgi:hypothetical protein
MRALGATPVGFAPARPITGLDGLEQQMSSIQGNQYDKVAKYLTANVSLWPRPLVIFANGKTWAALTPRSGASSARRPPMTWPPRQTSCAPASGHIMRVL